VGKVLQLVLSDFDSDFSHYVWVITVVCREVSHGQNRRLGAASFKDGNAVGLTSIEGSFLKFYMLSKAERNQVNPPHYAENKSKKLKAKKRCTQNLEETAPVKISWSQF